ncbi:MAG: RluA family pseudouridine synthase [Lentisphaeria bacterium]|nr:RluA family pseudouridine synthase [Lentisphaeria bacterium]
MKRAAKSILPEAAAGLSVLDYVAGRFDYHTRDEWGEVIEQGRVLLNEAVAAADTICKAGDTLEYRYEPRPEPPVDDRFKIVFRDETILVVDKPANLPCHPAGPYFNNTLWAMLKERDGIDKPRFVNRLDRETSGIVLVALTADAARHCARQLQQGTVRKTYLAVVEGSFPDALEARGTLESDANSEIRKKRKYVPFGTVPQSLGDGSQQAHTRFSCGRRENGLSLVQANLLTGRTHQIRATLLGLGFPVVGDKLYGVDEQLFLRFIMGRLISSDHQRLRLPRQALHAHCLELTHPRGDRELRFESPLPSDMVQLLKNMPCGSDENA